MQTECPFCQVDPNRILHSNEVAYSILDAFPVSPEHTLVVPRAHVRSIYDLSSAEQHALWELTRAVREALRSTPGIDGFNIGLNDGPAAGQTIEHAHIHVIPRRSGDCSDPRGGIRLIFPGKAHYWS
jgi:diadenosine tetraphosphate (Ap4A) HIT family hydrolase